MARKSRKRNRNRTNETQSPRSEPAPRTRIDSKSPGAHQSNDHLGPDDSDPLLPGSADPESTKNNLAENPQNGPEIDSSSNTTASDTTSNDQVIEAVESNSQLIRQLMDQFSELTPAVPQVAENSQGSETSLPETCASDLISIDSQEVLDELNAAADEIADLRQRNDVLHDDVSQCQRHIGDLETQNTDLAKQVANTNIRQTVATAQSGSADAMSWEERRELIIEQMEADSFNADEFVENLGQELRDGGTKDDDTPQSPLEYLNELAARLTKAENESVEREGEILELRMLLQNQSETRESGVAIGAAAIAQMVDSDELVVAERERLQQLQAQWEEKFRQSEIDASLERAKLSRERQELGKRADELEEQVAHMQREAKTTEDLGGTPSRRWLAKLGLSEKGDDKRS